MFRKGPAERDTWSSRDSLTNQREQDGWKERIGREGRVGLASSGLACGSVDERRYRRRALQSCSSFGALPWSTMSVALAMGCSDEERGLLMEGVESPSAPHRPWLSQKAYECQQRDEHRLASQIGERRAQTARFAMENGLNGNGSSRFAWEDVQDKSHQHQRDSLGMVTAPPLFPLPKRFPNEKISKRITRAELALDKERRRHARVDRKLMKLQEKAGLQNIVTHSSNGRGNGVKPFMKRLPTKTYPGSGATIVTGPLAVAAFGAG